MKIITNEKAYIQIKDLSFIINTIDKKTIPNWLIQKYFLELNRYKYDFIELQSNDEIEFLKHLDCIIDYLALKDKKMDELMEIINETITKKNELDIKSQLMFQKEQNDNYELVTQSKLLDFKINSIKELLLFKSGYIMMNLPDGISYPNDPVYSEFHKENKIKKILKKFRKKEAVSK